MYLGTGEAGCYITLNGTNIKFCVEVSVQSTTKSSPWLAELVLEFNKRLHGNMQQYIQKQTHLLQFLDF